MPAGDRDARPFAYQALFAGALAALSIMLLVALGGDRTARTTGAAGVIEATAGPLVTVARGAADLAAVPVEPSGPAEPAASPPDAIATIPSSMAPAAPTPADGAVAAAGADGAATPASSATGAAPTSTLPSPAAAVAPADAGPPASAAAPDPTTTTTAAAPATTTTTSTTVAAAPAAPATAGGPVHSPDIEAGVVPLTNRDRSSEGLGALSRNGCLDSVASDYAQQMARNGVLAHNPGAGSAVTGCRPGAAWGDNVGTSVPCSASVLEDRWMNSPSHRHNILTADFSYIGVGAWTDAAGSCWVQVLFSS